MLWTVAITPENIVSAFHAEVDSGVGRNAAHEHVMEALDEVVADLRDNDPPTGSVLAAMSWWSDQDPRTV